MKKLLNIFTVLVIIAAVLVAGYAVWKFTGISEQVTPLVGDFRVIYNDHIFKAGEDNFLYLPVSGEAKFEVAGFNSSPYTVKVEPNADITYDIGGQQYSFKDEQLTDYFIKSENVFGSAFIIDCQKSYTVPEILKQIWGEKIEPNSAAPYPYALVVISTNGEKIVIQFNQLININLNPGSIVL